MRAAPWIFAALVCFAAWKWLSQREVEHAPGVLVADEPRQGDIDSTADIERAGFRLVPRAEFSATVRVLRREDYSSGPLAELVPTDFAVGWGPMSDSQVLAGIQVSQGNRFYYWRTESWPIERRVIETHSANWHVIPENEVVRKVLKQLRAGSLVELRGKLVDIEGKEGGLRTSLRRDDTGAGACEILLASSARLMENG
jgi:hypothetical protein